MSENNSISNYDYLAALEGYEFKAERLIAISGVSAQGVPILKHDYLSTRNQRACASGDVGFVYMAYNQMTAQAEASSDKFINYIYASGVAVGIENLPTETQAAFLREREYGPSIEIRDYIYQKYGRVILYWPSVQNSNSISALVPPEMWHQVNSKPIADANFGLMIENPTWSHVPGNF